MKKLQRLINKLKCYFKGHDSVKTITWSYSKKGSKHIHKMICKRCGHSSIAQ